jgi:site-specific recombinase XerD
MTLIAPTLQAFFTDRLARQREASPRTIAAYRDTMRLLLTFVRQRDGKPPEKLDWDDLTSDVISAFLNHLEDERGNSVRTRNVRLTAIRSLFSQHSRGAARQGDRPDQSAGSIQALITPERTGVSREDPFKPRPGGGP